MSVQITSRKTVFFTVVAVKTSRNQLSALAGLLFSLFFDPEDGGKTFLRNKFALLPELMALIQNGVTR
jgi:hypothetical protein